jgi:aspartyl-tRNA(Asn)/glutamyl-tRNA(Gln) amidotransferase subunit A
VPAVEYAACQYRRLELEAIAAARFDGLDAWVMPSTPFTAMAVENLQYPDEAKRALLASRNTQPANVFALCGASLPIQQFGSALPVGLQLVAPRGHDGRLLSMALAFEPVLGVGAAPDLAGFLN